MATELLDEDILAAIFSTRAEERLEAIVLEESMTTEIRPGLKAVKAGRAVQLDRLQPAVERLPLTGATRGTCSHCQNQADWIMRVNYGDWHTCCAQHYDTTIERLTTAIERRRK